MLAFNPLNKIQKKIQYIADIESQIERYLKQLENKTECNSQ